MIYLNQKIFQQWMELTEINQARLCGLLGLTKGYLSQVLRNECRVSAWLIERFLIMTRIPFNKLFVIDQSKEKDEREFLPEESWFKKKIA